MWEDTIMGLYLSRSDVLKLKHINDGFVSYKHAAFNFTLRNW